MNDALPVVVVVDDVEVTLHKHYLHMMIDDVNYSSVAVVDWLLWPMFDFGILVFHSSRNKKKIKQKKRKEKKKKINQILSKSNHKNN